MRIASYIVNSVVAQKVTRLLLLFSFSILLTTIFCGCSDSNQVQADDGSHSLIDSASASEEKDKETFDGDTLGVTLDGGSGDLLGTASDIVTVGDRSVLITIHFEYEINEDTYQIGNILDARAENVDGWVYVARDVLVDMENILFNTNHTKAIVPITYSASLGEGMVLYDDTVQIDLSGDLVADGNA